MSTVKPIYNPFSGELDFIRSPDSTENPNTENRICLATLEVGDLVTESDTIINGVEEAVNNTDIKPVIGIVIEKPDATTATILFRGTIAGFSGLTKARKIFLSTTGVVSSVVPATGYLQCLGTARDTDTIDFNPELNRVLRN